MTLHETWCFDVEHALRYDNDGSVSSCCMMRNVSDVTDKGKSINELFNKPALVDIRETMNRGERHKACRLCWEEEDAGRHSKRIRDNKKYEDEVKSGITFQGITSMELNLGNTCNIKCRTCNPHVSTLWAKEFFEVNGHIESGYKTLDEYTKSLVRFHDGYADDSPFWSDLESHLSTLRTMVFYGGEPLLSKKMWKILEMAVELGYAKDISLEYNTNGTLWPEAIKVWKHFKQVRVSFSIDGIGDQFGYMRYPADWDKVVINMKKLREFAALHQNVLYGWCVTISPLNVFYVAEIVQENAENFGDFGVYLNLIHDPKHFNINQIPKEYHQAIIDKLQTIPGSLHHYLPGIIEFIKTGDKDPIVWQRFLTEVSLHDDYRKQSYAQTFPEFAKIIGVV